MATFFEANSDSGYQFTFINHSNKPTRYDLRNYDWFNRSYNWGQIRTSQGFQQEKAEKSPFRPMGKGKWQVNLSGDLS